ncbi:proton-coupled amino acid transporter-like protein CG1139 isoform X1 [Spodoptera frugiperda]|uniref:Proton-coupled amino acid transporter-like protein CG1139 isoform X1 n=2 Tax=Spodoptera frugiperda TaxID=7108 RepID=A0A9R0D0U3_SPOFR|nr:proton-coupled amino acid transporter-like protein CG1139 isoform X1 [Spodoptera frugiperda]
MFTSSARSEDYDPHRHRNVEKPTSYAETMTHMVKGCVGAGLLAMPNAFYRLGLIIGSIGVIFLGVFATYCIQILIIGQYIICKKHKVGYMSYPMSMRLALQSGPPSMRWSANLFAVAVDAFLIIWQIGVCAIFLVFVAENLKQFIEFCGGSMPVRLIILCLYPVLVMICLIKDLKLLAPLSTFSNLCNAVGLVLIFFYLAQGSLVFKESMLEMQSLVDIPVFIGIVLYALEAVGVVLALERNMENPKDFTGLFGLFSIGMAIIVVMYMILGIFGYIKYGDEIKASITLNLPQKEKKAQAAKLAFAATIFTSFPLQNFVAWQILWGILQKKYPSSAMDYGLRVGCATIPFAMAVAAPSLGPFIGLIGSLCLSTAAIMFPAIIDICVFYPDQYGPAKYKLFSDIFIIIFGIFCCFSGVYTSLLEMVDSLS